MVGQISQVGSVKASMITRILNISCEVSSDDEGSRVESDTVEILAHLFFYACSLKVYAYRRHHRRRRYFLVDAQTSEKFILVSF